MAWSKDLRVEAVPDRNSLASPHASNMKKSIIVASIRLIRRWLASLVGHNGNHRIRFNGHCVNESCVMSNPAIFNLLEAFFNLLEA